MLSRYNKGTTCGPCERAAREVDETPPFVYDPKLDAGFVPLPAPGQDRHGTTVDYDRSLLREGTKGHRGICSAFKCQRAPTSCWYSVHPRPIGEWSAFCPDHLPMDADRWEQRAIEVEEGRRAYDEWIAKIDADRLARRPTCARCGVPIDHERVVNFMADQRKFHRMCAMLELGLDVPDDVRADYAAFDDEALAAT